MLPSWASPAKFLAPAVLMMPNGDRAIVVHESGTLGSLRATTVLVFLEYAGAPCADGSANWVNHSTYRGKMRASETYRELLARLHTLEERIK